MAEGFYPVVNFNLIQNIRLVHALMESKYEIYIPPEEVWKLTPLEEVFSVSIKSSNSNHPKLDIFPISHELPSTSIGPISRPLIFARAICTHCRSIWQEPRVNRFVFPGWLSYKRTKAITNWMAYLFSPTQIALLATSLHTRNFLQKIRRKLHMRSDENIIKSNAGDFLIWSSRRGRSFPIKTWDSNYYELLSKSEYVLCPSGDYIWTYRFFEAALCGAIPIIEEPCAAYEGFRYKTMDESPKDFERNYEDAIYNFELATERLTVDTDVLNSELAQCLRDAHLSVGCVA